MTERADGAEPDAPAAAASAFAGPAQTEAASATPGVADRGAPHRAARVGLVASLGGFPPPGRNVRVGGAEGRRRQAGHQAELGRLFQRGLPGQMRVGILFSARDGVAKVAYLGHGGSGATLLAQCA